MEQHLVCINVKHLEAMLHEILVAPRILFILGVLFFLLLAIDFFIAGLSHLEHDIPCSHC